MVEETMPFGERRLHERKTCSRMIMIDDREDYYSGHLRDLTIGGALIEPPMDNDVQIGQELILTIPFGLKKDHVKVKAKVAWIKSIGVGVRFVTSSSESLLFK